MERPDPRAVDQQDGAAVALDRAGGGHARTVWPRGCRKTCVVSHARGHANGPGSGSFASRNVWRVSRYGSAGVERDDHRGDPRLGGRREQRADAAHRMPEHADRGDVVAARSARTPAARPRRTRRR